MVSDRHVDDYGYVLVMQKADLKDAGKILANHSVESLATKGAEFKSYIYEASSRYNLDDALIEAIIQVESDFNPEAVSRAGAAGLMQLMPETAKIYNVYNRFDPKQNILAGTKHLKGLMDRYDSRVHIALAAYNAGASAVDKYNGIPPFPETRRYIEKVQSALDDIKQRRFGTGDSISSE